MSIISDKETNVVIEKYDKYIFELNQAYFLTYSYSLSPNYLKQPFKTIVFSYYTNDLFQFINNLYIAFLSERKSEFDRISINSLNFIEDTVYLEINYYYTAKKKRGKSVDYETMINNFLDKLEFDIGNLFEQNSSQFVLSTIKLSEINKDAILNNFARLQGNLEKSYYLNENSIEFLINYLTDKFNPDYINYGYYTFQLKTYSILVFYIQNPDKTIINFLENIFKNAFYSSKNMLLYEPLVLLNPQDPKENNEVVLAIHQRLLLNNINVKMRILDFNGDKLVFIEKISNYKLKLKNQIVELVNNLYSRDEEETLFSLIFPNYIKEYYSELAEIYLKNNKKFVLENFYLPQFKTSLLPYLPYVSFDLTDRNKNPNYNKLVYIPILYIGNLSLEVESQWNVLRTQWDNYIYNFNYNNDIVIPRDMIINFNEQIEKNKFYYILVSCLGNLGVNYKTVTEEGDTFIVQDIEINNYDVFLEKQKELISMIRKAIDNSVETLIISDNKIINSLRELHPIYHLILKKKLIENNKNFVDFIVLEKNLVLLSLNSKEVANDFTNLLRVALGEKRNLKCDRVINFKIEYDTLITLKEKCFSIDILLELLETNKIKKYSREGQIAIKKLKEWIPEHQLIRFKTFRDSYSFSNEYKLSLRTIDDHFMVCLINRLTNEEIELFLMPNKVKLVNKLYDLWRTDNLFSDITYKFSEELGGIPRNLIKLKVPLETLEKLTLEEQVDHFNYYFNKFHKTN
jgi:hypothetical protein